MPLRHSSKIARNSSRLSASPIGCIATAALTRSGASAISSMMNAPPMHMPTTAKRSMPRWSINANWSAA